VSSKQRASTGFTLTEVMISLGILGIIIAATTVYLADLDKTRYRLEAMSTRDALTLRLKRLTTVSIVAFSASAFATDDPGNRELEKCLDTDNNSICTATNAKDPISFILGYPLQNSPIKVRIAGSDAQPVEYCHDGGPFNPINPGKQCRPEWRVTAYFSAICPLGVAQCPKAAAVRISHKLENIYLKDETFFSAGHKKIDGLGLRSKDNLVYTTLEIPQELRATKNPCNENSAITKIMADGSITCTCLPGSVETSKLKGQPQCTPQKAECPDKTQVVRGYEIDTSSGSPILKAKCSSGHNPPTNIQMNQLCGGYLNGLDLSGCTYSLSVASKKSGGSGLVGNCLTTTQRCVTPK